MLNFLGKIMHSLFVCFPKKKDSGAKAVHEGSEGNGKGNEGNGEDSVMRIETMTARSDDKYNERC